MLANQLFKLRELAYEQPGLGDILKPTYRVLCIAQLQSYRPDSPTHCFFYYIVPHNIKDID